MSKGDKWAEAGKVKPTPHPDKNSNYGSISGTKPTPAARDISDKVDRQANDATGKLPPKMTSEQLDAMVAELQASTPLRRIGPVAARMVFLQMLAVGYDLVRPTPGDKRKLVESDAAQHDIVRWLGDCSPLGSLSGPEAAAVFNHLTGMGYRIAMPDNHPSGLKTQEMPHVKVSRLGKGSHVRTIDRQGLPAGPVAIFNGGESE